MKNRYARITIDKKSNKDTSLIIKMDSDNLCFDMTFNSIDSLINLLKKPELQLEFCDEFDRIYYKEEISSFINSINSSDNILYDALINATPILNIYEVADLNIIKEYNVPFVLNIVALNYETKKELLQNNDLKEYTFIDKYTEGSIVSFKKLNTMYYLLEDEIKCIKNKNFSEAELVFYFYNSLKKRIYKQESENDSPYVSRSLTDVIKNEEIVCAGFTNYFNALCDIFNIKSQTIHWKDYSDENLGHASSIVYLNDQKYNLNGIWSLDITWDCKKKYKDKLYKLNLRHFLMPLNKDIEEKKAKKLYSINDDNYNFVVNTLKKYNSLKLDYLKEDIIAMINKIYTLLNIDYSINNNCIINEEVDKIIKLANQLIPTEVLENIVANVDKSLIETMDFSISTNYNYKELNDKSKELIRIKKLFADSPRIKK